MAVKSIELIDQIDNKPDALLSYGELPQGSTYSSYNIFKIVSDDGTEQFFKQEFVHDSYGQVDETPTKLTEVRPTEKTILVFQ